MENTTTFDPRDEVIEEFLDGQPRADKWREWEQALRARLADARERHAETAPDSAQRRAWDEKISELKTQVRVLAEEEAITRFVEDSVRNSLSRPRPLPRLGEDDPDEDDAGY